MSLSPVGRKRMIPVSREEDTLSITVKTVGVFLFYHPGVNRFYVGVSVNLYGSRKTGYVELRKGQHNSLGLQEAYDKDPHVEFYYEETDSIDSARELKKQLVERYLQCAPELMFNNAERREGRNRSGSAKREVVIAGRYYTSMQDAADQLGVTRRQVRTRVNTKDPAYDHWHYPHEDKRHATKNSQPGSSP